MLKEMNVRLMQLWLCYLGQVTLPLWVPIHFYQATGGLIL